MSINVKNMCGYIYCGRKLIISSQVGRCKDFRGDGARCAEDNSVGKQNVCTNDEKLCRRSRERSKQTTTDENAYKRTYDPSEGGCAEAGEGWRGGLGPIRIFTIWTH